MQKNQGLNEQLPCGGYAGEDDFIKENMKKISEQQLQIKDEGIEQEKKQKCVSNVNQCCQKQLQCKGCEKIDKQEPSIQKIQRQQNKRIIKNNICRKCKTQPAALSHKNQPICRECILKSIQYKCRLTLQNSMKVTGKSKILICFSGGLNSICLVNIMSSLKKRYKKHHLFGELRCIHIQQQSVVPQDYKQTFQQYTGIPLQIIKIEQIFESENKNLQDVKNIFSMFQRSANSIDMLQIFRNHLITQYAKKNNFDFIIKGLNGQTIATSIFKYFVKGVGGNVTQLSSIQQDCLFYYPLRQHLQKELQFYFYTLKCSRISLLSNDDDLSNISGKEIDDGLTQFILNLQTMYSHTAPAITRTSEKIESNRKNENRCKWCMLKSTIEESELCRKCLRMYECRSKKFDENKLPHWLKINQ